MEMFDSKGIILYIDDEEQNLLAFRSAFRRIYEVHTALSAEHGLQILETEAIEVIITDQRMPDMTGTEFLEQIIPIYPNIIRMILTGFSDMGAIVEAINRGQVYRYINKPWDKDDLKIAIDNALDSFRLRSRNKMLVEHLQEANHNLEQKVADRTAELRKKNENIIASITYAKRIQTAILPFEERIGKSLGKDNFFVFFQPKDIVSGDFYWLEEIKRSDAFGQIETINFVAVADCTGHGVPGAFMSMIGNQLLYEIIIKNHIYSPSLILNGLHKEVHRVLRQKETQTNDGMDMAILAFQKNKNITKLEYAGAMNPLYYVQNNEFMEIKATKRSIGGSQLEEERFFEKHEIFSEQLSVSSDQNSQSVQPSLITDHRITVYLCSDGFQDQFGGENNKKFMVKKFKNLLFEISDQPMGKQGEMLAQTFDTWKGEQKQTDDVTVMGIRI